MKYFAQFIFKYIILLPLCHSDAPLSPVLLPPSADTSMPVTVPVLVPAIVDPIKPLPGQSHTPAAEDERLADLLSRLQLDDDSQLLGHVMRDFGTVKDRYCKMLTVGVNSSFQYWKNGFSVLRLFETFTHESVYSAVYC